MKKINFLMLATAMLLAGCEPKEDAASLDVSPDTNPIVFSADAPESYTFTLETNQPTWDAVSDQDWCVVTKAADGSKSFVVTALPNTTASASAPAIITITAGNATAVTINATQNAADTYSVTVTNDGNGSVDSEPQELTGLLAETHIKLTAVPNEGYQFKQWVIESGEATLFDTTISVAEFAMPAENVSVKAEFEEMLPYLTITTAVGDLEAAAVYYFAGSGEATVDWGDGSPVQTIMLQALYQGEWDEYGKTTDIHMTLHDFIGESNEDIVTITISGNVTGIGTGMGGIATAIDASNMPTLEYLDCRLENISSLNVSGCSALKVIEANNNSLTSLDISDCSALLRVCTFGSSWCETLDFMLPVEGFYDAVNPSETESLFDGIVVNDAFFTRTFIGKYKPHL